MVSHPYGLAYGLAELQDMNKTLEQKLFASAERIDRCEQNAATLADKEGIHTSAAAALAAAMEATHTRASRPGGRGRTWKVCESRCGPKP